MTLFNKIQIGLLVAAAVVVGTQFARHRETARELEWVETQVQTARTDAEARRAALAAAEQRNSEALEAEGRAGNKSLVSLMRERAAAARDSAQAEAGNMGVASALANVLGSTDQQKVESDYRRSEMKANMGLFFRLTKLPPEKIDAYIDVQIEAEQRQAALVSALLRGDMTPQDGLRQHDADKLEKEQRGRERLGPDASAFLDSIADSMRNEEAKRQVNAIGQNMGENSLSQAQSDRLQGLVKTNLVMLSLDDVDMFRSPDEWAQLVKERQQNILNDASTFLTAAQVETLQGIASFDFTMRQTQMMARRAALGIK